MNPLHPLGNLDGRDLLEHLDAALNLGRLGFLVPKTADKILDPLDLLLLALPCVEERREFLRAARFILAVGACVAREVAVEEFVDFAHSDIEKVAVVRDEQHRASIILQKAFQPCARFEIEVVGRLVEEHDVGVAEQDSCQREAHLPTAGQFGRRSIQVARLKIEPREHIGDPLIAPPVPGALQRFADRVVFLEKTRSLLLRDTWCRERLTYAILLDKPLMPVIEGFFRNIADSTLIEFDSGLGKVDDPGALCDDDIARVLFDEARCDFHEGRFAGAVGTCERGSAAVLKVERGTLDEIAGSI